MGGSGHAGTDCAVCSIQRIRDDGSLLDPDPEMLLEDGVLTQEQVWQNLRKRWDAVYVSAWNKLYKREGFRTVLFQAFPGLYGLRVRGAIERMDAEQKQRYSEAR